MRRIAMLCVVTFFLLSGYASAVQSVWSTTYGDMQLDLEGSAVTGIYPNGGAVTGTLSGNGTFLGWWREEGYTLSCGPNNQWAGPFVFVVAADGTRFFGSWDECPQTPDQLDPLEGSWTGQLSSGSLVTYDATITKDATNFYLHIPSLATGSSFLWLDLLYVPTTDGKVTFQLSNYGVK